MFDIGWGELVVIGIVALIAIGPKELPACCARVGQWMGKVRRMASEFQGQFHEAMREAEMADLKKQVDETTSSRNRRFDPTRDRLRQADRDRVRGQAEPRRRPRRRRRSDAAPATSATRRSGRAGTAPVAAGAATVGADARAAAAARDTDSPTRRAAPYPRRQQSLSAPKPGRRQGGMRTEEDEKEIEATKAPLMEHLIELRSRLIKALIAFALTFIVLLLLRQADLQHPGLAVRVGRGHRSNSKFIYTALLEYFITQLKLAMFGAAFISFPVIATQIYMFVAPGLYRHERQAFLPYLVATPVFFFARRDGRLFHRHAAAGALLARHAAARRARAGARSRCCPRSANICR